VIGACDVVVMTTNHELADQIEQLVRRHIEVTRTAATAAVERAFEDAGPSPSSRPTTSGRRQRTKWAPKRPTAELAALGERFYEVLCRSPGSTMATLAPQVGTTPRVLQVAVARLKRARRVRAVGQRQHTRYFPMTSTVATAMA
jgi:hypothetical protein